MPCWGNDHLQIVLRYHRWRAQVLAAHGRWWRAIDKAPRCLGLRRISFQQFSIACFSKLKIASPDAGLNGKAQAIAVLRGPAASGHGAHLLKARAVGTNSETAH